MIDAHILTIHPSGFTIEIHLHTTGYEEVDATIHTLEQLGYRPTGSGDGWMRPPEGQPLCPRHKVVMHTREKQGDTWHSHRVVDPHTGEELYCRGYPGPSSPGWAIPA
jgi:hypothetical protein